VREVNFYSEEKKEDEMKAPNGRSLMPFTLPKMWSQLKASAKYSERREAINKFNAANKWKKRGISMTPVRYGVSVHRKAAIVNAYTDGTITVAVDGCEMGQGLNTKVAQVVAHELTEALGENGGFDMSMIRFADNDTAYLPNPTFTGGSTGSEGCVEAARRACQMLIKEVSPVIEALEAKRKEKEEKGESKDGDAVVWPAVCAAACAQGYNLSQRGFWAGQRDDTIAYNIYGACISEVEIDVLSGEHHILKVDILYDCGKSLNPAIDIGQCEGAFMMGVGFYMREEEIYTDDGRLITDNTWEYKPPCTRDVPIEFNVELMQDSAFERGVLSSKASGEPPLVLSTSVIMATRQAIHSARSDNGLTDFPQIDAPCTVDKVQEHCGVSAVNLSA